MKKIEVKICTGTLCYVMGGAELQLLEEYLPEELADRVEISGTPCLVCCNRPDGKKAPFVWVDGQVLSQATVPAVIAAIRDVLTTDPV